MKRLHVDVECDACGATGLYQGFMEGKGRAVVCSRCSGSGKEIIDYFPFTRRRARRGIKEVRFGSGLVLDKPTDNSWFPYKDFATRVPE